MSLIKLQGNASGTGAFTIAAPNGNTDRTLTLPDRAGTLIPGTIDGSGNVAFAGGIFLGGTGSANLLDDYEEGTWTPSSAQFTINGTRAGHYRIIGDTCFCWFSLQNISSIVAGAVTVSLPFASSSTQGFGGSGSVFTNYNNVGPTSIWINNGVSVMEFYNSPAANANYTQLGGANIFSANSSLFAMYGAFSYRI